MKSIVTNQDDMCVFCGNTASAEHHLIFGTYGRAFAEKHGLKVPVCDRCHNMANHKCDRIHDNPMAERLSKMLGQAFYECDMVGKGMSHCEARAQFIREYGSSFIL